MRRSVMRFMRGCVCVGLGVAAPLIAAGVAHAGDPAVVAVPGKPILLHDSYDLASLGYTADEFFVSGTATSYTVAGGQTSDGHWDATPAATAPYVTRIVVVRPADPHKFNGTVVVEWLNVSGGNDATPDWTGAHREIIRNGYAYVGVSAQKVGIDGNPNFAMGNPLKKADPARYGNLNHPGDAFSYDIYSQAGRILRGPDAGKVLGPLVPKRVIADGQSQSAIFLTTYINAVDPVAKVYDGFLVHSRFGGSSRLDGTSIFVAPTTPPPSALFRTDLRVPVLTVITETDLMGGAQQLGYYSARQPDNARLRVWEVAGAAHADLYSFVVGYTDSGSIPPEQLAMSWQPTDKMFGTQVAKPYNPGLQNHYVLESALWNLDRWIKTGQAPSKAHPLKVATGDQSGSSPTLIRGANGEAEGGVRTPWVDVPTMRLSGVGNSGASYAMLAGVGEPFGAATLDRIYPGGKSEYLKKFAASLDSAIKAEFILPADRQEILDVATASYHGPR